MNLKQLLPKESWIAERANYIGGSQVSTVLGLNPYETPLQLWLRKRGALPPIEDSDIMRFGNFFEPILALHFEQTTGLRTRQISKTYTHDQHEFLRANIDRQILANPAKGLDSTAVLELKTTTSYRLKSLDGDYPISWNFQLQYYLGITGYEIGYLQVYERDTCRFHDPVLIHRHDDLIAENMSKLINWWNVHMVGGKRPEPINGEDTFILYPNSHDGKVLEASPKELEIYQELKKVRSRKDDFIKQEEQLKTKLKNRIGHHERVVAGGKSLVSWKSTQQNRLDTTAFKSAHPQLFKKYLTQTKTRRFTVH